MRAGQTKTSALRALFIRLFLIYTLLVPAGGVRAWQQGSPPPPPYPAPRVSGRGTAVPPRPRIGRGGAGPGGSFDVTPPERNRSAPANLPNLDQVRRAENVSPAAPEPIPSLEKTDGRSVNSYFWDDPNPEFPQDSDFSTERSKPRNETGTPGVDLGSRNFNWGIPLVSLAGRAGLDLNLALNYNSLVWTKQGTRIKFDADSGSPSPGFRLGLPVLQRRYLNEDEGSYGYMLVTASGGRVELKQVGGSSVYESEDGSFTQMIDDGASALVRTTDGTQYTFSTVVSGSLIKNCTQIKDRNGNYISAAYDGSGRLWTITDTLGRTLTFNYDGASARPLSITQVRGGATYEWATFGYTSVYMLPSFSGVTRLGPYNQYITVLSRVGLPDGTRYNFEYTPFGQVHTIRHFAADDHQLSYTGYNLPGSHWEGMSAQTDCPRFTERHDWIELGVMNESAEVVTRYAAAADGSWTEVTLPDGRTKQKEYFATSGWQKGLTTRTETIFDGALKKWTDVTWEQADGSAYFQKNPRVRETNVRDAEGNRRRTTIHYDHAPYAAYNLPRFVAEYEADGQTVLRHTVMDYVMDAAYLDRRIIGLVSQQTVSDGAWNLQAKTVYGYDGEGTTATPAPAAQHDAAGYGPGFNVGRGNLTWAGRFDVDDPGNWDKSVYKVRGYNQTGSPTFERNHYWHLTSFDYADSFSDAGNLNTYAYATRVTDAAGYASTTKYNYHTGAAAETRRPSSGTAAAGNVTYETTAVAYDAAGRVEQVTNQTSGAQTRWVYPPSMANAQTFTSVVAGASESYAAEFYDGWGRVRAAAADHPGSAGGYRAAWMKYDAMGRMVERSNPTEIAADWQRVGDDAGGIIWTLQAYDWQGRPTLTTNPDGSTTELFYGGCGCAGGEVVTARDERGRRRKAYKDALGRLRRVEELDWNETVYSWADYQYNARDQLTQINHLWQVRTLEYDGLGRLWKRATPEQGQTTYQYDRADLLTVTTDARGATSSYGYDARHQVTAISYGVPAGVAATPNVSFEYDSAGSRTRMTDGPGHVTYDYDSLSRLTSETRYFSDLGQSYALTYSYGLGGQLESVTNPWGAQVFYNHDHTGQALSVTGAGYAGVSTYAHSLQYRASGALKAQTFGNNRQLSVAYDNRQRVARWDVSGVQGYDYHYQSASYQEKTGRVIYARSLYDQTLDRSYEYDHVGRLSIAHAGAEARAHVGLPQGSPWGTLDGAFSQGYEYDPRGNLTRRYGWGGVLGGSPGQNSEQVNTFWDNKRQGFGYDAAGNVTNDLGQSFSYDATGQQAAASYAGYSLQQQYDGDTLRVKKSDNGEAVYYLRSSVLGGQVVAELRSHPSWGWHWSRGYVYDAGGSLLALQQGGVFWTHQDPATKSQRITDQAGNVTAGVELDPWGGDTWRSFNSQYQPKKFTSYERDGNQSDEAMMRRYNRWHARFDQPDPYEGSYDLTNPQSFNRYAYVQNDPVNFVDPSGLTGHSLEDVMSAAKGMLKNPGCRNLFGQHDPVKLMNTMKAQGKIHVSDKVPHKFSANARTGKLIRGSIIYKKFPPDYGAVTTDLSIPQRYPARNPHIYFNGPNGIITGNLDIAAAGFIHELLHVKGRIPLDDPDVLKDKGRQSELNQAVVQLMCITLPNRPVEQTPLNIITEIMPRPLLPLPGRGGGGFVGGNGLFNGIGSLAILQYFSYSVSTTYSLDPPPNVN